MYSAQPFSPNPNTLTVLATYRCTAACEQCCFESSPDVKGGLTGDTIKRRIDEAIGAFPNLSLVVFSGGEVFLLKDDLYDVVSFVSERGLRTRIVSNGSWGKSAVHAEQVAQRLTRAGLTEINLSTGLDHQEWVPLKSVTNAAQALVAAGIPTLMTVEADRRDGSMVASLMDDAAIKRLLVTGLLRLQTNSWMAFHEGAAKRAYQPDPAELRKGCGQVFRNVVVTPHDNLSACCGLTLEHIPEMRLGQCDGSNMGHLYREQSDDFLKYWIQVDGPYAIIERVLGDRAKPLLEGVVHICQACVVLHKNEEVRRELFARHLEFVPEVMTRFMLANCVDSRLRRNEAYSRKE